MASRRTRAKIRGTKFIESDAREVPPRELARIDTAWHTATGLLPIDTISGLDFQARHLQLALNSGEPFRIARALAIEGGSIATRGQKMRPRVNRLLARAREIATRCGDPRALGIVEMSAGVAAYVLGDWVKSIEHCDAADSILADQCTGAVWELATARRFGLGALYYAGRLRELSQRSRVWLNDAINRGDLYAATNIRTGPANAIWLMDDDPEQARHEVRQAAQQWSQGGFHTQHFYATYTEVQIDLYQGDYNRAWRRVCELWKPLKRALLFRVELIRVEALVLRARAALASNHLKDADRCMRRLNRERSATARASALLVAAQRAQARGDGDDVATLFTSAADGFDVAAMSLHRMAAHYAQARAGLGTTSGDTVLQSLHKLGVADPQRFLSMLAPQSA